MEFSYFDSPIERRRCGGDIYDLRGGTTKRLAFDAATLWHVDSFVSKVPVGTCGHGRNVPARRDRRADGDAWCGLGLRALPLRLAASDHDCASHAGRPPSSPYSSPSCPRRSPDPPPQAPRPPLAACRQRRTRYCHRTVQRAAAPPPIAAHAGAPSLRHEEGAESASPA